MSKHKEDGVESRESRVLHSGVPSADILNVTPISKGGPVFDDSDSDQTLAANDLVLEDPVENEANRAETMVLLASLKNLTEREVAHLGEIVADMNTEPASGNPDTVLH